MLAASLPEVDGWDDRHCRGADLSLFFQLGTDEVHWMVDRARLVLAARAFCAGCPIRLACDRAGEEERYGLWGGRLRSPTSGRPVDLLAPGV